MMKANLLILYVIAQFTGSQANAQGIVAKIAKCDFHEFVRPFEGISGNAPALYNDKKYIVYLAHGGTAMFDRKLTGDIKARWFNPRSGLFKAGSAVSKDRRSFKAPDLNDWVLLIERI